MPCDFHAGPAPCPQQLKNQPRVVVATMPGSPPVLFGLVGRYPRTWVPEPLLLSPWLFPIPRNSPAMLDPELLCLHFLPTERRRDVNTQQRPTIHSFGDCSPGGCPMQAPVEYWADPGNWLDFLALLYLLFLTDKNWVYSWCITGKISAQDGLYIMMPVINNILYVLEIAGRF